MVTKIPKWLQASRAQNESQAKDFLVRALGRAGVMPVKLAEEAVAAKRITVNRKVVTEPFSPLLANDVVHVDGHPVSIKWHTRALMFHKTKGLVTAGSDPENIGTVFEALRAELSLEMNRFEWHAIGRLDRDTTGLLLFTNDEKLVAHATRPETHLPKRYVAQVSGTVNAEKIKRLQTGVSIAKDVTSIPAQVRQLSEREVELTITEGKFHQVKHMLLAVKLPTLALHRNAVGSLELDIPLGAFRELTPLEIVENLRFSKATAE
jgi:pseudouridine synthase